MNLEAYLDNIFRYLLVFLALPVFIYSANTFFILAWKGLKHKPLNIDLPVAPCHSRDFRVQLNDVFTGTGGGYFALRPAFVYYMLVCRVSCFFTFSF